MRRLAWQLPARPRGPKAASAFAVAAIIALSAGGSASAAVPPIPGTPGSAPTAPRGLGALAIAMQASASERPDGDQKSRSPAFGIHWQRGPELARVARHFRQYGLPVVRLWASGRDLLAIGVNPHGVPGLHFTQSLED